MVVLRPLSDPEWPQVIVLFTILFLLITTSLIADRRAEREHEEAIRKLKTRGPFRRGYDD